MAMREYAVIKKGMVDILDSRVAYLSSIFSDNIDMALSPRGA